MKPCDRWRERLSEHALGAPASTALAEHLAHCQACSAALREWKAQMEAVDAGIRQLAAAEPPPDAAARILAAARASSPRPRWSGSAWQAATAGALALVLAASVFAWKVHEQHADAAKLASAASTISAWKSPTASLLHAPAGRGLYASPQLGKYFYPLNPQVPRKERRSP